MRDDLALDPHRDVQRQPFFDAITARHHMFEHTVDRLSFGFGQEPDTAQVDAQHRNVGVPRELRGPKKGSVAAEAHDQFASLGGVRVGVDDLDVDAQRAHIVRSQL